VRSRIRCLGVAGGGRLQLVASQRTRAGKDDDAQEILEIPGSWRISDALEILEMQRDWWISSGHDGDGPEVENSTGSPRDGGEPRMGMKQGPAPHHPHSLPRYSAVMPTPHQHGLLHL